jgi:two-component system, OmpR family, response regulator VicR
MDPIRPHKIVYVEDDPEMVDLVSLILSRNGYEVKGSNTGLLGFELIKKEMPDLILLDLMIPDLDGWDLYKKIKSEENEIKNIPIIVITAKSQPIDRVLGLHIAKVDDYLGKPFRPQELMDSIENILNPKSNSINNS